MRIILATVAVLALACAGVGAPEEAPSDLAGSWQYYEHCGENAGGVHVGIGYSLEIAGAQATLDGDGYQTMLRAAGAVQTGPDGVSRLLFSHLREPGAGSYLSPGDVMFSFTVEDGDLMVEPGELIFTCTEGMARFTRAEG